MALRLRQQESELTVQTLCSMGMKPVRTSNLVLAFVSTKQQTAARPGLLRLGALQLQCHGLADWRTAPMPPQDFLPFRLKSDGFRVRRRSKNRQTVSWHVIVLQQDFGSRCEVARPTPATDCANQTSDRRTVGASERRTPAAVRPAAPLAAPWTSRLRGTYLEPGTRDPGERPGESGDPRSACHALLQTSILGCVDIEWNSTSAAKATSTRL